MTRQVNPLEAFEALDLRVGRVRRAEANEQARKPSIKLWIDFGPLWEKTSSAQLRALCRPEDLVGRLVVAAVNLGTRNIAGSARWPGVLGSPRGGDQSESAGTGRTTRPVTSPSSARLHSISISRLAVSKDALRR